MSLNTDPIAQLQRQWSHMTAREAAEYGDPTWEEPRCLIHKHRSEAAEDKCLDMQSRPRCVQCGDLLRGWAKQWPTGAASCRACYDSDFGPR